MNAQQPNSFRTGPDERGHFGIYGGRFVAETLMPLILDLERAYAEAKADPAFHKEEERLAAFVEAGGGCRATYFNQAKKLQPELRPEQREQGEKAIHDAADKLATRWTDSCLNDLVGKFAPEESLKCAMSSKTPFSCLA